MICVRMRSYLPPCRVRSPLVPTFLAFQVALESPLVAGYWLPTNSCSLARSLCSSAFAADSAFPVIQISWNLVSKASSEHKKNWSKKNKHRIGRSGHFFANICSRNHWNRGSPCYTLRPPTSPSNPRGPGASPFPAERTAMSSSGVSSSGQKGLDPVHVADPVAAEDQGHREAATSSTSKILASTAASQGAVLYFLSLRPLFLFL